MAVSVAWRTASPYVDSAAVAGLQMPVVWTPRHRGHAPDGGYWLGVREAGDEEPERGDVLHDGLRRGGRHDRRCRRTSGWRRSSPCTTPTSSTSCAAPTRRGSPRVTSPSPGQPHVVPLPVRQRRLRGAVRRKDRRPATIRGRARPVRDGHDVADERGHVRCRLRRGPRRRSRRRPGRSPGERAAYAAVRPPGHHAGPAFFGGSCYFNNAAAGGAAVAGGGFGRVAIVDIDAHQGNGTQEIFWDRDDVLYASVHVDPGGRMVPAPRRPRRRARWRRRGGWTHQRADPAGSGDEPWLAALERLLRRSRAARSDALVVSLGVDAAVDDPAAPLMVTAKASGGRRAPRRARPCRRCSSRRAATTSHVWSLVGPRCASRASSRSSGGLVVKS